MAAKPRRPSTDDIARLGPELAMRKATMDPKRWKAIVRYAHGRGFTVGGALSGAPDPLKERMQSSLVKEAKRTVADAYRPAEQSLDSEALRTRAIAERRRTDEQAYNQWAQSQRESLLAQARQADDMTRQASTGIQERTAAAYRAAQERAIGEAARQGGRVSDPAQSSALNLAPEAARGVASTGAAGQQATDASGRGLQQLISLLAAGAASNRAGDQLREADSQGQLGKIAQARTELGSKRGEAYTTVLGGLRDKEAEKAQANQEFQAAAEKLGLESFKARAAAEQSERDYGLKKKQFNLQTWIAKNKVLADKAKVQLGYDKIAASDGKAAADRRLKKWIEEYRAKHGTSKTTKKDKPDPKAYQTVETVKGQLLDLHKQFQSGKTKQGRSFRQVLRERGYSDPMIDVAEDLRRHNGKLSRRGKAKAKALGIDVSLYG